MWFVWLCIYGLYMVDIWCIYIYVVYWSISGLYILTLGSQVCNPCNPNQLCIYIYMYIYIYIFVLILILYHIWKIYSDFTVTSLEFSEKKYGGIIPRWPYDSARWMFFCSFFSGCIKQLRSEIRIYIATRDR
jgi:hypothetical protein